MQMGFLVFIGWVSFSGLASAADPAIVDQLTRAELLRFERGEVIEKVRDHSESAWPAVTVFQLVDATPEEAMAIAADTARQKHYVPDIQESSVVNDSGTSIYEVAYVMEVRVLFTIREAFRVQGKVAMYGDDVGSASYRMDWHQVWAETFKSNDGTLKFEPYLGKSAMYYYNYVVPTRSGSGLLRGRAIKNIRGTADSVAKEIPRVLRSEPTLYKKQLERLRQRLSDSTS